jgi:hypothetical protein
MDQAISVGGSKIDSMMAQAEKLAQSDKPSDQLKAQQLMNKVKQMFETLSKILQMISEMFKTMIGGVARG